MALQVHHDNFPAFIPQPHHFAVAYYLCLYLYAKKPLMNKLHVPGVEFCAHMSPEDFVKRFVCIFMKYSIIKLQISDSIIHKSNSWHYKSNMQIAHKLWWMTTKPVNNCKESKTSVKLSWAVS